MAAKKNETKTFAGRYAYDKPLGRGAGGAVYLAEDLRADRRQVALKVLTAEAYATVQGKMLRREFEILSKLDHPHLVRVYDYGRLPDGGVFLAEEYIDGFSLQDARALLEPEALIDITLQILNGLSYLHGMGMIHRDIKPANVMLLWLDDANMKPMVKLVDFGLSSMDPKRDTLRGGTRSYMAPEIIRGEKGEPQSDMFSLGVTLYYALCGVLPFGPRTKNDPPPTEETFRPPEPHRLNPSVPLTLSRFTMALLRQLPGVEFLDAGEAMQALASDVEDQGQAFEVGRFANSLDTSSPQILHGYFERGILQQQTRDHDYLVSALADEKQHVRSGSVYLIAGEAGTGKSRLLREVETACKLSGRFVVYVDGKDAVSPAEGVFILLHQLMEQTVSVLEMHNPLEKYREHLSIAEAVCQPAVLPLMVERQGRWILQALQDVTAMLHRANPVVFIEDLHCADQASIDFLMAWLKRPDVVGVLDFVISAEPIPELIPLTELASVTPIVCEGLTAKDVRYLFEEKMHLDDVPTLWAEQLANNAAGKPSYLEECCRMLLDNGVMRRTGASGWELDAGLVATVTFPSGLRESFRRRLNGIGATGRELLELMVILDRPITWQSLRELAVMGGEPADRVDSAIETLHWRHLIKLNLEMSGRTIEFIEPEVQHVVDLLISPEWRRALHRRTGQFLLERWQLGEGNPGEVAHHLDEGGKSELARRMWRIEGLACMQKQDWASALEALGRVVDIVATPQEQALAYANLARAALAAMEAERCNEALRLAMKQVEVEPSPALFALVNTQVSRIAWEIGDVAYHEDLYALWSEYAPVLMQQPACLEVQARQKLAQGELAEASRLFDATRLRYLHFGNIEGSLRCASQIAVVAGIVGDAEQAGKALQNVYDLARTYDLRHCIGEALLVHARLVRLAGDYDKAMRLLHDALDVFASQSTGRGWIELLLELASLYEMENAFDIAEQRVTEALLLARQIGHGVYEYCATVHLSDLVLRRAADRDARAHCTRIEEAVEGLMEQKYLLHLRADGIQRAARALSRIGEQKQAESYIKESARLGRKLGAEHIYPESL